MSRKLLIILLVVSGGINLFLAGVIVTSIVLHGGRHGAGPHGPGPRAGFHLFLAVRNLDEPHRTRGLNLLRENRPLIRSKIRAVRQARRELRRTLRRGEATAEEMESAFRKLHTARGDAQKALYALVRQIVEKLNPEQRKKFYREAFRPRKHRRDRHRRRLREERERRE